MSQRATRPEEFMARPRERVRPKLAAFAAFVFSERLREVVGARGVRILRGELGKTVVVERETVPFVGAFHVSLATPTAARVGEGTVNGERPIVDGRYLDGTIAPEGTRPDPRGEPEIPLGTVRPVRGRSYICVLVVAEGGDLLPESLTLVHRADLRDLTEGDARTYWPVAELMWIDGRPERVRQMVWHDLVWEEGKFGVAG